MSSAAAASTVVQDTHIVPSPNPSHVAPSTSFDSAPRSHSLHRTSTHLDDSIDDDDDDGLRARSRSPSISSSILQHLSSDSSRPRRHHLPPLPDLRFEQSYLASLAPAHGVWWRVALITVKDQLLMPLVQGVAFNLAVFAWRRWNSGVRFRGKGLGARIRRWWWEVNNWKIPDA